MRNIILVPIKKEEVSSRPKYAKVIDKYVKAPNLVKLARGELVIEDIPIYKRKKIPKLYKPIYAKGGKETPRMETLCTHIYINRTKEFWEKRAEENGRELRWT